jgi:hypothetical protein
MFSGDSPPEPSPLPAKEVEVVIKQKKGLSKLSFSWFIPRLD